MTHVDRIKEYLESFDNVHSTQPSDVVLVWILIKLSLFLPLWMYESECKWDKPKRAATTAFTQRI